MARSRVTLSSCFTSPCCCCSGAPAAPAAAAAAACLARSFCRISAAEISPGAPEAGTQPAHTLSDAAEARGGGGEGTQASI